MSDLQDLHRQASRALISFAPRILDKLASSECPERMGWHILVLTKAAPGSKRSTIELSHLGKSQYDEASA